ncbi:MAG: glutamyl-tRNA synthetase [Patiriisocius sp.]|jgi:glutamyl-tRNA synthetase
MNKIITRFAPSPTGFMHIGGVRTALFAYLYAKKIDGDFILRIEDTDKSREVDGSIKHIKESLSWLGIDWEYGPDKPGPFGSCLQSDRLDLYKEYAQKLIDKGLAYPDPYTSEELEAFREKAKEEKRAFLFRDHRPETFEEWDGTKPLRFKVTDVKRHHWNDVVRGELEAGEEMLDDIIIIKADGYPTYNFAHIVDDNEMEITHIMRGEEFIASTPKFLSLYDALEIPYPIFVTMPPIMAADGKKKLGKRDGAKDLLEYRAEGYLPEAMVNFLALIGWNPGTEQELFTKDDLITTFSLEKIQKSGGAFNEEKLLWMNKEYLQKLDAQTFTAYAKDALPESILSIPGYTDEILTKLSPSMQERVHIKSEITQAAEEGEYTWAFTTPTVDPAMVQWKKDESPKDALPRLQKAMELLSDADFSSVETIKAAVWDYAEEVGRGELLWPLRVSLTGRERSPDPFTCAYILGKEESLKRLTSIVETL